MDERRVPAEEAGASCVSTSRRRLNSAASVPSAALARGAATCIPTLDGVKTTLVVLRSFRLLLLCASLAACDDVVTGGLDGGSAQSNGCGDASVSSMFDGARDVALDATCTRCGNERPSLGGVGAIVAVLIGPDGTLYYSQPGGVGRQRIDGTRDNAWLRLPGGVPASGLALDLERKRLYATSAAQGAIYLIDLLAEPPDVTVFVAVGGRPGPVVIGPDRALYYGDTADGNIWRVDASATRTRVTGSPIAGLGGLSFFDGDLFVGGAQRGSLWRLTVGDGVELSRVLVASDLGVPAGMAFDADGFLYLADSAGGRVLRVTTDGLSADEIITGLHAPTAVEFGAGVLVCSDLYVATANGLVRHEMGTTRGGDVPWHR